MVVFSALLAALLVAVFTAAAFSSSVGWPQLAFSQLVAWLQFVGTLGLCGAPACGWPWFHEPAAGVAPVLKWLLVLE